MFFSKNIILFPHIVFRRGQECANAVAAARLYYLLCIILHIMLYIVLYCILRGQECANAVAAGTTVKELSMMVHTHPTLSEVLDEAFKGAVGMSAH